MLTAYSRERIRSDLGFHHPCRDGDDNDYDGLIDCADPDCYGEYGSGKTRCGITEINCTDNIDNDLDGLIDYEDSDECSDTMEP